MLKWKETEGVRLCEERPARLPLGKKINKCIELLVPKRRCLDIHPLGKRQASGGTSRCIYGFARSWSQQQVNAFPSLSAAGRGGGGIAQRYTIVLPADTPTLTVNERWAARWWFSSLLKRAGLLFLSTLNDTAFSVMQISTKQRAWALQFVCRTRLCHWGLFSHGSCFQAASLQSTRGLSRYGLTLPREWLLLGHAETGLASSAAPRPFVTIWWRTLSILRDTWCSPGTLWLLHQCCSCIAWSFLRLSFKVYQL